MWILILNDINRMDIIIWLIYIPSCQYWLIYLLRFLVLNP
jgi:hypothetical protein